MNRNPRADGRSSYSERDACQLLPERSAEALASLEGTVRHLPAERDSSRIAASCNGISTFFGPAETDFLGNAASLLGISIDDFLLAGFCGLLSRLTWQETISVVRLSPSPSLVTFGCENPCSFRAGVSAMQAEEISLADLFGHPAVSYLFLEADEPACPPNETDLQLAVRQEAGQLAIGLSSATGRWSESTLEGWLRFLRTMLQAIAEDPDASLKQLPLLEENALEALYEELNQTGVAYPSELGAHDLIARQAEQTPQAVAVVFGDKQLTYRELEERSTQRARQLMAMGAGPNRPVAICMERSENLPVALLAVLKAGSCYVPLDPSHPKQRIALILEESRPVAVLSDAVAASLLEDPSAPVLRMDEVCPKTNDDVIATVSPDDLAYIIYTSGTTGKPKGVTITHGSLVNLLESMRREPGMHAGDRMLAVTTISFDIATMEMLLPLVTGATLVIADRHAGGDPFRLAALIEQHDATVLQATPFTWRLLASSGWSGKRNLKMIAGGEALPRDLANELVTLGGELWNCYGPTETTIWSGVIRIERETGIVPIGSPIANTTFYVMDEGGRPVPKGVPGELYIGGAGVSRGYLLRPELTAQRFVANPFAGRPGEMLFRTGDLVRLLNDKELEFLGRLDHQVKLRGFRIELGEIESILRTHSAVENAAVVLREDIPGELRLVAYVTLNGKKPRAGELRDHVANSLPEYMLPARIVVLDALPLTGSGKVDRRGLPLPESLQGPDDETHANAEGAAPQNDLEVRLLEIFRDVLSNSSIGVTDDFFDYGGYSLLTARLFSRIHRALGVKLPISLLFDARTPRALAKIIQNGTTPPVIVPIRTSGRAAPLFVIHSYLLYSALKEALEEDRPIYGIRELDNDIRVNNLEERAALYAREIEAEYPDGPLCLAGWCAAGSLTVEVARQLSEERIVALVALFDSERPGYKPQIAGGGSLWKARLISSARFHKQRLQELNLREKLGYLSAQARQRWEDKVEDFSMEHRISFHWLQRHFPALLPMALRDYAAGLGPEDLRPTGQQIYPGKIVLVRASDVVQVAGTEPGLGWDSVAMGGVEVTFAPGDHESMFRQPHLRQFGEILHRVLREAEVVSH